MGLPIIAGLFADGVLNRHDGQAKPFFRTVYLNRRPLTVQGYETDNTLPVILNTVGYYQLVFHQPPSLTRKPLSLVNIGQVT